VGVPGYDSWWDVAVAEVSQTGAVQKARAQYVEARKQERHHLAIRKEG
jgi:3D-(3,5/4)-trihydroxycyclohexane-1,2-dione acylhydrolase (decyclizing)